MHKAPSAAEAAGLHQLHSRFMNGKSKMPLLRFGSFRKQNELNAKFPPVYQTEVGHRPIILKFVGGWLHPKADAAIPPISGYQSDFGALVVPGEAHVIALCAARNSERHQLGFQRANVQLRIRICSFHC